MQTENADAYVLLCSSLVFLMVPGVSLFYSGMLRVKNALHIIQICMLSYATVAIQWTLFGFSLSSGASNNPFIGGKLAYLGLGFDFASAMENGKLSLITYTIYQLQFAAVTSAIIFGGIVERCRVLPTMLFTFVWTTIVYDPIAYWTWNSSGWLHKLGFLDFSGGAPVHMASGFAALAYALIIGGRIDSENDPIRAHNLTNVYLGTGLLVFGWMGFNGGNAVIPGASASLAAYVTLSAACSGGISWIAKDWIVSRKLSGLGFCSGMVAGMVCITPCSGYIAPWAALIVGAIAGVVCNFACSIKVRLRIDDSLDVFAIHGVSGLLGTLLCGIFADSKISKLRSFETQVEGGVISGNFIQLAIQLLGSVVVPVYSFCVTVVILYLINKIPGFKLRIEEDNEYDGVDMTELGEIAVDFNFPRSFQYVDEFKE